MNGPLHLASPRTSRLGPPFIEPMLPCFGGLWFCVPDTGVQWFPSANTRATTHLARKSVPLRTMRLTTHLARKSVPLRTMRLKSAPKRPPTAPHITQGTNMAMFTSTDLLICPPPRAQGVGEKRDGAGRHAMVDEAYTQGIAGASPSELGGGG